MFTYVVETERRFYLANEVKVTPRSADGGDDVWFELELLDAWVWDMYRPARFVGKRPRPDLPRRQRRGASPTTEDAVSPEFH